MLAYLKVSGMALIFLLILCPLLSKTLQCVDVDTTIPQLQRVYYSPPPPGTIAAQRGEASLRESSYGYLLQYDLIFCHYSDL